MSKYADVYLLPIAEANVPEYKKIATRAGKIFVKNGAIRYREYVASDLEAEGVARFDKLLKLKPGETVIFATVEFKSEAHRKATMKKIMSDPELTGPDKVLFDYKRMVYAGFKILVDL